MFLLENHLSARPIHTSTAERRAGPLSRGAAIVLPQQSCVNSAFHWATAAGFYCKHGCRSAETHGIPHTSAAHLNLRHHNQSVQPRFTNKLQNAEAGERLLFPQELIHNQLHQQPHSHAQAYSWISRKLYLVTLYFNYIFRFWIHHKVARKIFFCVFERSLLCSSRMHLFDKKNTVKTVIMQHFFNLK